MGRRVRGLAAACAAAGGILASACDPIDGGDMRVRITRIAGIRCVEMQVEDENAFISLDTCICFTEGDPFDVRADVGDLRGLGEAALSGLRGGIELSPPGPLVPLLFAGMSLQFVSGGTQVYSYTETSAPSVLASTFFPGTRKVQLRMARDEDGNVLFYARERSQPTWTSLGSQSYSNLQDRLRFTLGAFGGHRGARMAFSGLRTVHPREAAKPRAEPAEAIERDTYETLGDLFSRRTDIEDFLEFGDLLPPEFEEELAEELADIDALLQVIEEEYFGSPAKKPTGPSKLRSAVRKARKHTAKAVQLVGKGKHRKALDPIEDAIRAQTAAVRALRSIP